LTGPAGPKTLPYEAVCRLPTGKLAGILTDFKKKVKRKSMLNSRYLILDSSAFAQGYGGQAMLDSGFKPAFDKSTAGKFWFGRRGRIRVSRKTVAVHYLYSSFVALSFAFTWNKHGVNYIKYPYKQA
jgi:hypothetical protein